MARLDDPAAEVRRQAALSLGWCGGRRAVAALLEGMDDPDWLTRQAAHVGLSNLTGMEWPFNGAADLPEREKQAQVWRDWWARVPPNHPPCEVLALVAAPVLPAWDCERGVRALGTLRGEDAASAVTTLLSRISWDSPEWRPVVRAGLRALGRLGDETAREFLIRTLENTMWARHAAEALSDFDDPAIVPFLLRAYSRYAKRLDGTDPEARPPDDRVGFPSEDRMLETPYWIAYALCRLPMDSRDLSKLRELAPVLLANLPGDHDTFMLYQPEAGHLLTRYLLERSGLRQEAAEQAFERLALPRRAPNPEPAYAWPPFDERRVSAWLPCVVTEAEDLPRLLALVEHTNGWVRINAAKATAWLGDPRAVAPIAEKLALAKAEADYGYTRLFKDDEYDDPSPRAREALVRALGLLKAADHVPLIARILDDERSVLELRHAAASALADIASDEALAVLERAARDHPIGAVRNVARDALVARGIILDDCATESFPHENPLAVARPVAGGALDERGVPGVFGADFEALLFVKGDNDLPNSQRTVEQADRWRQTYVVTDEGPSYRPGNNLYVLRPPRPDGIVTPLTRFTSGYVGEPEISWDGAQVIFTRREENSLWWQIWRVNADGSQLHQLTDGPYHHVGPVYLPDGRIMFASSRSGLRDEYHGYPCTALYVMNADGSGLRPVATNIGRDNEPAVLTDGRVVFSRLEVFYSRNKTELTLHAAHPDGMQDSVIYGPERRAFWRQLDHGPPAPDDLQEAPLTHRVLRMTQPQPMPDGRHIVVSTQGGLALVGPSRETEQLITPDFKTRAYTTPMPLADGAILCAATLKNPDRKQVDLGIYRLHPDSGKLELIYNDPGAADYEARPLIARRRPPVLADREEHHAYSGQFLCVNAFDSTDQEVVRRGRIVRLIEGVPVVGRHSSHTSPTPVWQNHGGTLARVLGMAPLAADGSFYVQVPADRLMQLQVLDSDRRVIGNQLTWIYARPGETKSCVGCHENPHTASGTGGRPLALRSPPLRFYPTGREFSYRAKAWMKGSLPSEVEERTRTVRAVTLLGR